MGWDAHAIVDKNSDGIIKDPDIAKAFAEASEFVLSKTGTVDGYLKSGGLDVSNCGNMLEKATGTGVYNDQGWDAETAKVYFTMANWDFYSEKADK